MSKRNLFLGDALALWIVTVKGVFLHRMNIRPCDSCDFCRETGVCVGSTDVPPETIHINTTRKFVIVISLLIGCALSCNLPALIAQTTSTTPTPSVSATSIRSTETDTPTHPPSETAALSDSTETATSTGPAQISIPTFTNIPTSTPTPIVDEISVYCKDKRPFVLIFLNPNASYELKALKGGQVKTLENGAQVLYVTNADGTLGERVRCFDGGFKEDGRKIAACVGIVKMSFEVNVCDPTRPNCVTYKLTLMHCPRCITW